MFKFRVADIIAVFLFVLVCIVLAPVRADDPPPPGNDDWKYDVVYLKKGKPFRGLIIEDKSNYVRLLSIIRKPGKPTVVMEEKFNRPDIDHIDRLNDADRDELEQRVTALRRDRERLAAQLKLLDPAAKDKSLVDKVSLRTADWPGGTGVKAFQYESTHFKLVSNAKEEVVQLAAIQLEQVYAAYTRALPPRVAKIEPTTIVLTGAMADYKALARDHGSNLVNPAFYDEEKNKIVCGSDLQRLSDELERLHKRHVALAAELTKREKELQDVYKGAVPAEMTSAIKDAWDTIKAGEEHNRLAFKDAQRKLFQRLYHEAFHAYLLTAVYPRADGELPRWLNEGLAQIFETAIFEAGELRVGHADMDRLKAVRDGKNVTLLPLTELLNSGPKQFQVAHASEKQVSDRHYLASWALAFYLTFDRKVLGTRALDDYVQSLRRGTDTLEAFEELVGVPLPQFEKEFHQYLKGLQADGSVKRD